MSDEIKHTAMESVPYDTGNSAPSLREDDELLDMGEDFNFDDFQVVRREFFAHLHEPSVSFNNCKFYVNAACLARFPDSGYAQVLVNSSKKILALRPCNEGSRDSFMWCTDAIKGKRKPKPITCKLFFAKIVKAQLVSLIETKGVNTFLFGSRSEFDDICHEVVTELREHYPGIERIAYTCKSEWACMENEREEHERGFSKLMHKAVSLKGYESEVEFDKKNTAGRASYRYVKSMSETRAIVRRILPRKQHIKD